MYCTYDDINNVEGHDYNNFSINNYLPPIATPQNLTRCKTTINNNISPISPNFTPIQNNIYRTIITQPVSSNFSSLVSPEQSTSSNSPSIHRRNSNETIWNHSNSNIYFNRPRLVNNPLSPPSPLHFITNSNSTIIDFPISTMSSSLPAKHPSEKIIPQSTKSRAESLGEEEYRGSHQSSHKIEDKTKYALNINKVKSGQDTRTTLMIKNIPNKYTQKMLLATVDEKHKGTYDFFYLPIDFKVLFYFYFFF